MYNVSFFLSWYSLETGMISNDMIYRDHIIKNALCSLGSVLSNIALGTVFINTLPRGPTDSVRARILHHSASALEIALGQSLGPWGVKSPSSGNLSLLWGVFSQYIPPLGSVR